VLWLALLALVGLCAWPGAGSAVLAQEEGGAGAHGEGPGDAGEPAETDGVARTERVWAAVGLTQSPVAICIDPWGNVYVAESDRAGNAVSDTRNLGHLNGVEEDLQMTSVEDRLAQINRWVAEGAFEPDFFTRTEDRVRVVRDTDGDGVADDSAVFAGGFNDPLDGIGAGLLWLDGGLYYTCIPHVWRLEDVDGDGDADEATPGERVSLSYGYGIRWAFYGHDLHGLVMGPDGRLYFSMGDRGFNVVNQEGERLYAPERGAVFRMWPDGSGLEVFHIGLRNPQELAFDSYGNLYTGDNNCDAGDKARFVHLVEGGDSGWHQDVQSLPDRGPWLREKMWELRRGGDAPTQPAWIIPPIAHVGYGPSGLAHYPGTGDRYPANGSFLMANFPGEVRHVLVEPDGAWSRVARVDTPVTGKTVTDVCWGYDGRLYLSDWGGGWSPNPNGFIYTLTNEAVHQDADAAALIAEVRTLFAEGFDQRSDDELVLLLGHADQRVRLHAQYELAGRDGVAETLGMASRVVDAPQMQRVHAIWTLGMIARREPGVADAIAPLLTDADPQVRTQAVKTLGDLRYEATEPYTALLRDEHPQARFYAALALGKTGAQDAVVPLLQMLVDNDNRDPMLRHAGSYALSLIDDTEAMLGALRDSNPASRGLVPLAPAGRLGIVLALRRNADPALAGFLQDADPLVVAEAGRAIYDMQVAEAMPALAAMPELQMPSDLRIEPVLRRVIEANAQLGGAAQADRLARLAGDPAFDAAWRRLAIAELDGWGQTKQREGVWGHWRPRPPHDVGEARAAFAVHIDAIEAAAKGDEALAELAAAMRLKYVTDASADVLGSVALNTDAAELLRRTAVDLLADRYPDDPATAESLAVLADLAGTSDELKNHARALLTGLDATAALRSYLKALTQGSTAEQQQAITQLAALAHGDDAADFPDAIQAIADLSLRLKRGDVDPALRLEAYQAVRDSPDPNVAGRATDYRNLNPSPYDGFVADTLLAGGDPERGRVLAYENENANCLRCHAFAEGDGGGAVGPMLDRIGSDQPAPYLLQSLLDPGAVIADGYQSVTLTLNNGSIKAGRIVSETRDIVTLANGNGDLEELPAAAITKRTVQDTSLMPTMADRLSARELRDLVAYLQTLQDGRGPASESAGPSLAAGGAGYDGPSVHNPGAAWNHAFIMPVFLLGTTAGLMGFALLVYLVNQKA
jgi:quinoprotein glucose dehydrogenase